MAHRDWLGLKEELPERLRLILTVLSFVAALGRLVRRELSAVSLASSDPHYRSGKRGVFRGGHGSSERGICQAASNKRSLRKGIPRGDIG